MAQLSFVIVPSRANSDGSHQIRLKITNVNTTAYLVTKFSVDTPGQFQNGMVVKHPRAIAINKDLRILLGEYEEMLMEMGETRVPASQIKKYLEHPRFAGESLKEYADKYIAELKANGQTSYAQNMGYTLKYLIEKFGEYVSLSAISLTAVKEWEKFLIKRGDSPTTINIRMTHLKALLNAAVNEGVVEYKIFPFNNYKMPAKNVRDICISKGELAKLRDCDPSKFPKAKCASKDSTRRLTVARDLFMLSFYCAGINLTDLMSAKLNGDILTFVRKKTAEKKTGADKEVSMTIQPEAREIIDKYINERGELNMGYRFKDYEQFRSFVTKSLNRIGEELGFEKRLTFYSARKTFVQFGSELGIPLYILEYAIGQTIKEANDRPVFNYLKIMRSQADLAIRTIIDYSFEPTSEDEMPLPEWARRR
ncbi:MAG: site-specific integrase [Bacteroidales bacterium]|nr:site-specific integrase [Bacteroidales bacterium]